jgi:hypothetical protein
MGKEGGEKRKEMKVRNGKMYVGTEVRELF